MKYENGASTRKAILDACILLFLRDGYKETSYDRISQTAHVNRGTINYHFKEKEEIRYEVLWEMTIRYRHLAAKYTPDSTLQIMLAIYMNWNQSLCDPCVRRFNQEYGRDYPVYSRSNGIARFYEAACRLTMQSYFNDRKIDPLAVATAYGYMTAAMQLVTESPEEYTAKQIFIHAMRSIFSIWGLPEDAAEKLLNTLASTIDAIPQSEIDQVSAELTHPGGAA